ncbi:hypothetical protein BHS88_24605, partial [Escherichia coli]
YQNNGVKVVWETESTSKTGTVMETILGCWRNFANEFMRLSILITRGFRLVDSNGEYCYAGLGVNFGNAKSMIIGFTPTKRVTAEAWSTLRPEITFSHVRATNGDLTFTVALTLAGTVYNIVLFLNKNDKYVTCTAAGGTTQKIS